MEFPLNLLEYLPVKTNPSKSSVIWGRVPPAIPATLQYWLNELPANEKLKQTQIAIANLRLITKHLTSLPK